MSDNDKNKLSVAGGIVTKLLTVLSIAIVIFTAISLFAFDKTNRNFLGYNFFAVLSDSMSTTDGDEARGHFKAGDLIIVKKTAPATLKAGDIISYISTDTETFGEVITHMIRSKVRDEKGAPAFVTYGTHTGVNDYEVVSYPYVLGKYQCRISGAGRVILFLKSSRIAILAVIIFFAVLFIIQLKNSLRLFRQYRLEAGVENDSQGDSEL